MCANTSLPLVFGHRSRGTRRVLRAGWLSVLLCGTFALAQTVSPLIDENVVKGPGKKAKGKIEYVNDSLQPLTVTLDTQSFTVFETGEMLYRPLDPGIHVKFSATSFRIPPKQNYFVFYEASADTVPAWFVVYATFAGYQERTEEGLKIQLLLPHTVYLLPKGDVQKSDLVIKVAEFRPTEQKVLVRVENNGPTFGRILEADVSSSVGRGKVTNNGFPVFPHSQRQVEIPWDSADVPKKLTLHLGRFSLEQPIRTAFP